MINLIFFKLFFINFCLFLSSIFGADVTYSSNTTLSSDLRLSLSQRAIINANLTLNGAGYFFQFPITSDQVLVVNNGYTATFQNILFNHFQNANLSLGTGSSIVLGSGCVLNCIVDQTLTNVYNVSGPTTILGNGTTIHLGNGAFSVSAGGSLTLENVTLTGVSTANLLCVDNTGTIKFSNVTIAIPSRWQWSNGAFSVNKYLRLKDGIFAYTSGMSSTILSASELVMSNSLNFSYDPIKLSGQAVASQTNLVFSDTSSKLTLSGGISLYITNTGMKLLKGSLNITGQNYLYSDALSTITSQGLILGNGSFASDFNITNFASLNSGLNVKKGLISYNNAEIYVEPPPAIPLRYGDGVILRHQNYGTYLSTMPSINTGIFDGNTDNIVAISSNTDNHAKWLAEPGNTAYRFGSPSQTGNVVTSGSPFRLENFAITAIPRDLVVYLYVGPGVNAAVSTPRPPYHDTTFINFANTSSCFRIHKRNSSVGSPINQGDSVYLLNYTSSTYYYIGSSNLSYSGYAEVYTYQAPSSAQPSNLDTNLVWVVDTVIPNSYLTAQAWGNWTPVGIGDGSFSSYYAGWPSSSSTQF